MNFVHRESGFTLLEVMIATTIMTFVGILAFMALRSSSSSVAAGAAQGQAQANVRDVIAAMTPELEVAAKEDEGSINLQRVRVYNNNALVGADVQGDEIRFQVPTDSTGTNWSSVIRYRFENEDANNNGLLDGNEDTNGDGLLTRRVVRVQDLNNDGDTADPGEVRPLGGANDISALTFSVNQPRDTVTITLSSTKAVARTATREGNDVEANLARSTLTSRVYIMN